MEERNASWARAWATVSRNGGNVTKDCDEHCSVANAGFDNRGQKVFMQVDRYNDGTYLRDYCRVSDGDDQRNCTNWDTGEKRVFYWLKDEEAWRVQSPQPVATPELEARRSTVDDQYSAETPFKDGIWQTDRNGAIGPGNCDMMKAHEVYRNRTSIAYGENMEHLTVLDNNEANTKYVRISWSDFYNKTGPITYYYRKSNDGNNVVTTNVNIDTSPSANPDYTPEMIALNVRVTRGIIGTVYYYCGQ